ncbi:indolepyruvate ferredoxin oxidoreductase family protein [Pseudonocardia abyssalis]|uniref:Indolepyruvate ferredoxin oxidoreductase family protein n=1 Tax=Pseudonocardia abyssalis TaxID=2792008 RepID=A0ABS6UR71_9PSEU|nr:indolepyruvate ferredoxin oxidoreductase family protein [Pseudonocardia abyssalis]MBW0115956.1 indolepyruvate ferredoxin oxidoreductase family protein [Pseudonocardia abyssalis]MBW0134715.1 indolepyruvate ferredoxin oxidoreductase family protein [Pseudonocardia abyssalis]
MTIVDNRPQAPFSPADRYDAPQTYLTGVQALVRLVLEQQRHDRARGLDTRTFVSGYEGSPLAGLDLELGRRRALLDEHGVVFTPGLNEEAAAMAVQGTQLAAVSGGPLHPQLRHDGVAGLWYGKAPGLDRACDAIRHANLMGTHRTGGVLAAVGDDPGAKSSSVPCASEFALADLAIPTLYPADPGEVVALGLHGIALSRASGLWAGLKMATAVADGSATARFEPDFRPVVPELELDGRPWRHTVTGHLLQPVLGTLERDLHRGRLELARRYAALNRLNTIPVRTADDRIGIVAAGKTWLDLRQALTALGLDDTELRRRGVRLLKLGMVWPLEPGIVEEFASGLREIVVVEEKRAFVESGVKDLLYGRPGAPAVHGKRAPDGAVLLAEHGELEPDAIAIALASRLADLPSVVAWNDARRARRRGPITLPITTRTPYFCSGCPHNSSTKPASEDSLVGGGIGCHAMVLLMEPGQVGEVTGLTQMGGEGTQWIGMAPFVRARHLVQNLGDGTFHHSGSLAVRAAVASGVDITYKLLHNGTVAMTGGQDAVGALSVPAITRLLAAEGVARTIVTTDEPRRYRGVRLAPGVEVWPRERLGEAQEVLATVPGVTVLIHDQACAAEKRRKRKRGTVPTPVERVMINERVCEGCGDCGKKSNCLSVQPVDTEFGRKTRIDQSSCNLDFSCLEGDCPSFLTVTPGESVRRTPAPLGPDDLPEPVATGRAAVSVRLAGVGGTGIVTVAQVLAAAAVLAGRHVRGLDQTGLAQKGGAVVSDLRITAGPVEAAGRLAARECDLYLGADLLVAADPATLAVTDPARTVAVVSTTRVPTGAMVVDTTAAFPDVDAVSRRISDAVRSGTWFDARALAERLFGEDQYANMLLVGAAYQTGALPLPAAQIERAIELNGVAVAANVQAFRRGRQVVADPGALDERPATAAVTTSGPVAVPALGAPAGSELARLVGIRVPELVAYQDAACADRYVADVERVRATEAAAVPGSTALAETVAVHLHKLVTYKDEYEVARLSLDPALAAEVQERFGAGATFAWRLHPPALRALGMQRKITLGRRSAPVFRLLRAMRRLRGTPFDVFGYARVRRLERELVVEYRAVVDRLVAGLTPATHAAAVDIAGLPDMVRGYEDVKLESVARYRARLAEAGA